MYLPNAYQRYSPNYDERPLGSVVDLLVIHNISLPAGDFSTNYVEELFCNTLDCNAHPSFVDLKGLHVSAHLFIRRDGRAFQFVPLNCRAWHAGVSCFEGRSACNDYSIGIELEGTDYQAYTLAQYATLGLLTQHIQTIYPAITPQRIVGHSDIAPERKTDPGPAFDWRYYFSLLNESVR